jgi:adenylylsulfate kinase
MVEQGINVIICTISMFDSVRDWNRDNIKGYKEIYVRVLMETLHLRDQKGLYSRTSIEKEKDVAGIDFKFEEPKHPDIILDNDGEYTPAEQVDKLLWFCDNF